MKNVAMKKHKTRPKMPTIVNTKPEATLFCRKDVLLPPAMAGGEAIGDGSAVTVCVTVGAR